MPWPCTKTIFALYKDDMTERIILYFVSKNANISYNNLDLHSYGQHLSLFLICIRQILQFHDLTLGHPFFFVKVARDDHCDDQVLSLSYYKFPSYGKSMDVFVLVVCTTFWSSVCELWIEQKGMPFDHDFCYSFSFSSSLFFIREEKRGKE